MCGICGYIGKSKSPAVTHQLITQLFEKTEVRGRDAAGVWGTEPGDGKILYHKEPIKSSNFVKTKFWQRVAQSKPDLLLLHARLATPGVGLPSINRNNHPFTSKDLSIGLIHNGKVPAYDFLVKKYEVESKCDSEILLRMYESGCAAPGDVFAKNHNHGAEHRLAGIRDIWSFGYKNHMAVAVGERLNGGYRRLCLFRNDHRSLWLADMRDALGQIFFFSTLPIWHDAIADCSQIINWKSYGIPISRTKLTELPSEEVWVMETSPESPVVSKGGLYKYRVKKSGEPYAWNHDDSVLKIKEKPAVCDVITKLDDDCNVIDGFVDNFRSSGNSGNGRLNNDRKGNGKPKGNRLMDIQFNNTDWPDATKKSEEIANLCESIRQTVNNIETSAANKLLEASMSDNECDNLINELTQMGLDLEGTLTILDQ